MPQAVTHLLIPAFLIAIFRDFYKNNNKRKFSLYYVLIAGLGGVLPDIDIVAYWVLYFFNFTISQIHRNITHTIFFPLFFLALALLFYNLKIRELGKHHLKASTICLVLAFGIITHIILDALLIGQIMPLYPLSQFSFGLNIVNLLPYPLNSIVIPTFEGILLVVWMVYLEVKHKISDFI